MSGDQLNAFLDGVRAMVDQSDTVLVGLSDVEECGRTLLENPTAEAIAAARAELDSAIRILRRRGLPIDSLAALGEELGTSLLTEVATEARRDVREYSHSLGERMLAELLDRPSSPSDLAEKLGVEISQISRAARILREDGRMHVEQALGDGRRRIYKAATKETATGRGWSWKAFVERLPTLSADDVCSDLLPGRVGDGLSRTRIASVCAAFKEDLESGRYEPTPIHEVFVPKKDGGNRPAAALRFSDRLAYAALVERCRSEIELNLVPQSTVLWPRGFKSDMQWGDLEGFVSESNEPYVLSVDIQSFYDSIRHDVLSEALSRAGCDRAVVLALEEWLGEITGNRKRGLPQGLAASDPLATVVLTPLDQALTSAGVCYMRHGDDLRVLGSHEEVQDAERLVRETLRRLELTINDDKTRTLHVDNYLLPRKEVSRAAREYLEESELVDRDSVIFKLLDALGADEQMLWSWYHRTLTVSKILSSLEPSLSPSDSHALMIVLEHVAKTEELMEQWKARLHGQPEKFLMRAGMSLLAATGDAGMATKLEASMVARPEYADVLSTYVKAVAPVNPRAVAGLLQRIEATGITYDAQWLHLYEALGDAGDTGEFDYLAQTHLESTHHDWIRRLRAARFMANRGQLDTEFLPEISNQVPPALRDDVLDILSHAEPHLYEKLSSEEGAAAKALIAAAA